MLNQPRYQGASILLARKNFGCGSSREHAPWALQQYGFRAVIAPSFADIFFNNCFKNGLLPIVLTPRRRSTAVRRGRGAFAGYRLTIDLDAAERHRRRAARSIAFEIEPFRKHCLLNGLDDIGLTLRTPTRSAPSKPKRRDQQPWLFN